VATTRTAAPVRARVIPFPGKAARAAAHQLRPTPRSLLVSAAIAVAAVGLYVLARETSMFAVTHIQVEGAPPGIAREVNELATAAKGESLLELDGEELVRSLRALPTVAAVTYDRAFPHTLRLIVKPERPVAIIRQGSRSWVVSMRGRIIRPIPPRTRLGLPRIWLRQEVPLATGKMVGDRMTTRAVSALNPLVKLPLPARIAHVRMQHGELTLVTASRIEIQLGIPSDLPLKLAIARHLLPDLTPATGGVAYLDVSVPERVVSGVRTLNPQVEVDTN
jgi:cell division protein FtsQ